MAGALLIERVKTRIIITTKHDIKRKQHAGGANESPEKMPADDLKRGNSHVTKSQLVLFLQQLADGMAQMY